MEAYELPILEKIEVQKIDKDINQIISGNVWKVINDKGYSESIIFKNDGTFLQNIDGMTTKGTYEVLEEFGMLHIICGLTGMILSPLFETKSILVWRLEGTSRYVFFVKRVNYEFQVSTYEELCYVFKEQYEIQENDKREILIKQDEDIRQKKIAEKNKIAYLESITHNGHQFVDLGLPSGTMWAKCNVGAYRPESCGSTFDWGEIESKEKHIREYKWDGGINKDGKFNIVGRPYKNNRLLLEYDAANANWGGDWRMPTKEEIQELLDNCKIIEERFGFSCVSCNNGNSIFFPKITSYDCIHHCSGGTFIASSNINTDVKSVDEYFYYPSVTPKVYILGIMLKAIIWPSAHFFNEYNKKIEIREDRDFKDMLIRPVFNEKIYTVVFHICDDSNNIISLKVLSSEILIIPGTPILLENFIFDSWNTKPDGKGKTFKYGDEFQVFGNIEFYAQWESCEDINYIEARGIRFVDLGLSSGILWSINNYGANSQGEHGVYRSWGGMFPKSGIEGYTVDAYALRDMFIGIEEEHINELREGLECYRKVSGFWRDAKAVSKHKWPQVPTKKQFEELYNECIWEESIINAYKVHGWIVRSKKNRNAIFLPAVGYIDGRKQVDNEKLILWTRTIDENVNMAYVGGDSITRISSKDRFLGLQIRLVLEKED